MPITKVMFRKYPKREGGDILAIMPYEEATRDGCVTVYQHVGGHGAGRYHVMLATTKPAKPEEYAALKRELESAPYSYILQVVSRYRR